MKKPFTEAQIVGFLREADAGIPVKELCRKHGFSDASYYLWRSKFGGMRVPDAKRLKALETENTRLKKLLASSTHSAIALRSPGCEQAASAHRLRPSAAWVDADTRLSLPIIDKVR